MNQVRVALAIVLLSASTLVAAAEQKTRLQWAQKVTLSTPVSGVINEVLVQPGERVAKGQTLLSLDQRALKAKLKGAQAELTLAEQNHQEAQRELDRTQEMYDRTMLAEHDLELAKIDLTAAESQLQIAQSNVVQAQWNLDYSAIKAPFDAWVIKVHGVEGQTVMNQIQASPLLEVAKAGSMRVRGYLSAAEFSKVRIQQPITIRAAGDAFTGSVQHIALESNEKGEYAVDVVFDTQGRQLRAGLPAVMVMP
jgi:multidrug efflux system membrane fusion protein